MSTRSRILALVMALVMMAATCTAFMAKAASMGDLELYAARITLESTLYPGLYAVGEALDVDGACGGFNLHWAFASGLAAGRSAGT